MIQPTESTPRQGMPGSINPRLLVVACLMMAVGLAYGYSLSRNSGEASTFSGDDGAGTSVEELALIQDEPTSDLNSTPTSSPTDDPNPIITSSPTNQSSPSEAPLPSQSPAQSPAQGQSSQSPSAVTSSQSSQGPSSTTSSTSNVSGGQSQGSLSNQKPGSQTSGSNSATTSSVQRPATNQTTGLIRQGSSAPGQSTSTEATSNQSLESELLLESQLDKLAALATSPTQQLIYNVFAPQLKAGKIALVSVERFIVSAGQTPRRPDYARSSNIIAYTFAVIGYLVQDQVVVY